MTTQTTTRSSSTGLLLLLAIAFGFMGVAGDWLFLAGTIVCFGAMTFDRPGKRGLSIMIFALAAAYFFMVFGYGIGKDMARRDKAVSTARLK